MKSIYKNTPYFIREARTIFKVDFLSNILSVFSIGLIFLILSLILTGWWISNDLVSLIEDETEISIYFSEDLEEDSINDLLSKLGKVQGIRDYGLVSEAESYDRMVDILGREAEILNHFEENPFSPFIEVKIEMDSLDHILSELEAFNEIDHIRDNRQVLDKLRDIISFIEIVGLLLASAIGVSTAIIISHIIRQGIYNNRDEINTLKLLGAPNRFIQLPFYMEGIFPTMVGGILAAGLWLLIIKFAYSNIYKLLPFMPLAHGDEFILPIMTFLIIFSFIMGAIGSKFGLKSIK